MSAIKTSFLSLCLLMAGTALADDHKTGYFTEDHPFNVEDHAYNTEDHAYDADEASFDLDDHRFKIAPKTDKERREAIQEE